MTQDPIISVPAWLPGWIAGGFGTGVGAVGAWATVKWAASLFFGRVDKREENLDRRSTAIDAATAQIMKVMQDQIDTLARRVDAQDEEITELRAELKGCRDGHAEAAAEVLRLKAIIQGYGDARNMAQRDQSAEALAVKGVA